MATECVLLQIEDFEMTIRQKYPRTYHFEWSHLHADDKRLPSTASFEGKEIVVLEKLDGENTTIYPDGYLHARSIDSRHNFTRDWAKRMASVLCHDIPDGHRFVFENVTYYHSIEYTDLESFCYLLSIWNNNTCIDYDSMLEYAQLLDLATPKEFYRGVFDEEILRKIANEMDLIKSEGYVVRTVEQFDIEDFQQHVAKFVRDDHVQPDSVHWLNSTKPNRLKESGNIKPYYMAGA